ncbi:hypothetical protein GGR52DRAFT_572315 [Hypoxylon sp. FL1284]|nr:hypothetical protein GGR52DRAFT_572315 [Hypoxylon sp. FL1284]
MPTTMYPLTTTFTPAAGCDILQIKHCVDASDCTAQLPFTLCPSKACYPAMSHVSPRITYSPGHVCPLGMATAARAISPAGFWCCPTGMTWAGSAPLCSTVLTEGTFTKPGSSCGDATTVSCGDASDTNVLVLTGTYTATTPPIYTTTVEFSITLSELTALTAVADGIFLEGQTMVTGTIAIASASPDASTDPMTEAKYTSAKSTDIPQPSNSADRPSPSTNKPSSTPSYGLPARSSPLSTGAIVGSVVGSISGAVTMFFLFVYWMRKQNRRKQQRQQQQPDAQKGAAGKARGPDGCLLHSSGKPELDASASSVRCELEGSAGRENLGAGIYFHKPELEGNLGICRADGRLIYVATKAELEAVAESSRIASQSQ